MRIISQKNKEIINSDDFYRKCVRCFENNCRGRITIEHAWLYAGKQIDELWNFIPLCTFHHNLEEYVSSGQMDKQVNQLVALLRATPEDLKKYPRVDWEQEKKRLIYTVKKRYGENYLTKIYRTADTKTNNGVANN